MKISVIIPIVRVDLINNLLGDINCGTKVPDRVIIIDNSNGLYKHAEVLNHPSVEYRVICPESPLGVNASWNLGVLETEGTDAVCILNDDIRINKYFLQKIERIFENNSYVSVLCPYTIEPIGSAKSNRQKGLLSEIYKDSLDANCLRIMSRREGWSMIFRKSFLDTVPPIPTSIKTFCGDDWFWSHSVKGKVTWYQMVHNKIFHLLSSTVNNMPKVKRSLKSEKEIYSKFSIK